MEHDTQGPNGEPTPEQTPSNNHAKEVVQIVQRIIFASPDKVIGKNEADTKLSSAKLVDKLVEDGKTKMTLFTPAETVEESKYMDFMERATSVSLLDAETNEGDYFYVTPDLDVINEDWKNIPEDEQQALIQRLKNIATELNIV